MEDTVEVSRLRFCKKFMKGDAWKCTYDLFKSYS